MPRISWNANGTRFYETGIDRGVLYVDGLAGVPWTGLTSVVENATGGDAREFYIDGVKYLNLSSAEEFAATINAFTYPAEFSVCDGTARVHSGLFVTQQPRKSFNMSYRSKIGNDSVGTDFGYKIHIVYNALAGPSQKTYKTLDDSADPSDFSWNITTRPPAMVGYRRTAHLEIDSRYTNPGALSAIEDVLYGTDSDAARVPTLAELVDIYDSHSLLSVIDNDDGTYTVTGPDEMVSMIDAVTYQVTSDSAMYIDADTYTLSSL